MTELIKPSRRLFLGGLGALVVAAPAIVQYKNIMPVKVVDPVLKVIGPAETNWWVWDVKLSRYVEDARKYPEFLSHGECTIKYGQMGNGLLTAESAEQSYGYGVKHELQVEMHTDPVVDPGDIVEVRGEFFRVEQIQQRPLHPPHYVETMNGPVLIT